MPEQELMKAIKIIGSQQKLATSLGIRFTVVNNWLNPGIRIPLKHALKIEVITNGLIKAEFLNPEDKEVIHLYQQYLNGCNHYG